jgi:hypothetical protein
VEIKLKKPLTRDEKTIDKINLDLDALTGEDIIKAEKEARMRGDTSPNPLFSSDGLSIIAAKASGMIVEDIRALAAPDFLLVTNTVSNFLYGWVLPTLIPDGVSEKPS